MDTKIKVYFLFSIPINTLQSDTIFYDETMNFVSNLQNDKKHFLFFLNTLLKQNKKAPNFSFGAFKDVFKICAIFYYIASGAASAGGAVGATSFPEPSLLDTKAPFEPNTNVISPILTSPTTIIPLFLNA